MIEKALDTIKRYSMLENVRNVVIGVSGGVDSVVLLHFMNKIKEEFGFNITAAHINHCLRGEESERDEQFVRNLCRNLCVELKVLKVDVAAEAKKRGEGEEECGRHIRYEFFSSLCSDGFLIATAHNLNDSLETVILNIARGTGVHGLCGIAPKRGNIIRPLIECSRSEIEKYCKENGLSHITDSSNFSRDYKRNIVRLDVIPKLYEINPSLDKVVLRMLRQNTSDDEYILSEAVRVVECAKISDTEFDISVFETVSDAVKRRAITLILKNVCGSSPESNHISKIQQVIALKAGMLNLPGDVIATVKENNLTLRKFDGYNDIVSFELPFLLGKVSTPLGEYEFSLCSIDEYKKIYKNYLKNSFDYDKINGKLFLRNRRCADKITLAGRNCSKTLKKLFNESKTEPVLRSRLLFLCDEKGIVWIQGFGAAERVKITDTTKKVLTVKFQ